MLHPVTRIGLMELRRASAAEGLRFDVTSGFRSRAVQARLYDLWQSGSPAQRNTVAPPGRSTHEWGLAIDVVARGDKQRELVALAQRLGWSWAGPRDPVHLQVVSLADWSWALSQAPQNPLSVLE